MQTDNKEGLTLDPPKSSDLVTRPCAQMEKSAVGFAERALSQVYDRGNCRGF
jgi:hypothetical protein